MQRRQVVQTFEDEEMVQDASLSEQSASEDSSEGVDDNAMEWTGIDGDKNERSKPSNDSPGSGRKGKKAIPTGEELRVIKEGEELFKSNTFKLQVRCLIRMMTMYLLDALSILD